MVDALALKQIFSLESAAWIVVALIFLLVVRMWNGAPALLEQWILYKQTKAAEKLSDWNRLRDEIKRLSDSEQQCRRDFQQLHRDYLDLRNELADLRGYLAGQGRASQEAAGIVAIERLGRDDKKSRNGPAGGGK